MVLFGCTLAGSVVNALFGLHVGQNVMFVVGCLLAALATRRSDLLPVAVSPPLVYFTVTLLSAILGGFGERSFVISATLSIATALTSAVPWLFVGSLLVLAITTGRGLPANLRELRERVAVDNPFQSRRDKDDKKDADEDPVRWDD